VRLRENVYLRFFVFLAVDFFAAFFAGFFLAMGTLRET